MPTSKINKIMAAEEDLPFDVFEARIKEIKQLAGKNKISAVFVVDNEKIVFRTKDFNYTMNTCSLTGEIKKVERNSRKRK